MNNIIYIIFKIVSAHINILITKHRSQEDIDKFGFLKEYKGIIVHDHYKMYYNYVTDNDKSNVHVLRYLNIVFEFTNRLV